MSFTVVKKLDGLSVIVTNTVKDANGNSYAVSVNALDTGVGLHALFGATVEITPLTILSFKLFDNRIFKL